MVQQLLAADEKRRGGATTRHDENRFFVYYINAQGIAHRWERGRSSGIIQYVPITKSYYLNPELVAAGWMFLGDACADAGDVERVRQLVAEDLTLWERGTAKARAVFSPPEALMPTRALRMQLESGYATGAHGARVQAELDRRKPAAPRKVAEEKP
jgi:hypothetical protein